MPEDFPHLQILVVEDEAIVALDLEYFLQRSGYDVTVCATVRDALAHLAADHFDGAILDVNVGGELVFPVADKLRRGEIPFVVVSGNSKDAMPERYRNCPFIAKPYEHGDVLKTLSAIVQA